MSTARAILRPAVWAFYVIIVFEILFMISPFALYFYSAYGPALDFLERSSATAWLTKFYLPHFSRTTSPVLNSLRAVSMLLMATGLLIFFAGAIPIYWAKFRGRGPVTGGLYRIIRHPQYTGLAIVGVGTALLWPRFAVLIALVTMLFLYTLLADWEEEQCISRFGRSYHDYQTRTGMFLPMTISRRLPRLPDLFHRRNLAMAFGVYVVVTVGALAAAVGLRNYALSRVVAAYSSDLAVISPALLTADEFNTVYRTAADDARVKAALDTAGAAKLMVYVLPQDWYVPVLPLTRVHRLSPPHTPRSFDRRYYKVLFTRALLDSPEASGSDIVKAAYGREPLVTAYVDISGPQVTRIETPPAHVYWGDIPTPMF